MVTSQLTSPDTAVLSADSAAEVAKAVAAFLNTSGGRLLLGVDDKGRVEGISNTFPTQDLYFFVKQLISPEPRFSVTFRPVGDKEIALIDVPTGTERPYVVDDQIFVWRAGQLANAAPKEISDMIITRGTEATRWERQPVAGVDLMDLDHRQLMQTQEAYSERSSHQRRHGPDAMAFLADLGLASAGQLLNSAVILFARPETSLPQSRVKIAAFQSNDRTTFIENKLINGNLFDLFEQITLFLDRHISVSSRFEEYKRHDVMAIPPFVIRESIMNALVHRDYTQANANVTVALHPDRLEVWNPGHLPEGLSPENLPRTHVSRPTNPDIANVAFLRGLVEQWGSGTGRIVSECRRMGLKDPEWASIGGGVRLTVFLAFADEESSRTLNDRMRSFLLRTYPGQLVSVEEYHSNWGGDIGQRTARRDLDDMTELGFLVVKGQRPLMYMRTDKSEA